MFNLHKAIRSWKKELRKNWALEDGYIEELESHLRDEVEEGIGKGLEIEEAFAEAVNRIGSVENVGTEYYKSDTSKNILKRAFASFMPDLLLNYVKIAFRFMRRQKIYSTINISGLAVGVGACLLIFIYIIYESTYDRYHTNSRNIYRLSHTANVGNNITSMPKSSAPTAKALTNDFPEIVNAVRFNMMPQLQVRYENKTFTEKDEFFADNSIFQVFSFPLILGDSSNALARPYTVVLTESASIKYFGDENPLGKKLMLNDRLDCTVTGVMKDVRGNSHFSFDLLCSFETLYAEYGERIDNWMMFTCYTYLLFQDGVDYKSVEQKFPEFVNTYFGQNLKMMGAEIDLFLQPLTGIHWYSKLEREIAPNGDISTIKLLGAIAILILLMACINYINLSTARASRRSLEVGLRKTIGATRFTLINQFLGESIIYSIIAFTLGLFLAITLLPLLNDLTGLSININYTQAVELLPVLLIIAVFIGLLAGLYPAYIISSYKPVHVLNKVNPLAQKKSMFRNVLVVTQFSISIFLIACTAIIFKQLDYMKSKELGFDKDRIVSISISGSKLQESLDAIREEFKNDIGVSGVSAISSLPGNTPNSDPFRPEGFSVEQTQWMDKLHTDYYFTQTMGLKISQGRSFSEEYGTDINAVLINQEAADKLGWTDPIGKEIASFENPKTAVVKKVVGVIPNFHFESFHKKINPVYIDINPKRYNYLLVRLNTGNYFATIERLKDKWKNIIPNHNMEMQFLNESYDKQYKAEDKLRKLFTSLSALVMFIAALGLFGLSSFMSEQRRKEIGIRKVLGAPVSRIVYMLTKDFTKWVLIANLIAWIAIYFFANNWLANFAYKTEITIWLYIMAGLAALLVAVLTVSYQALKASLLNPIESIKYE